MSNHQNQIVEQLTSQLSVIQKQLSQLTSRFDKLENNLSEEVASISTKISQLEEDLILSGDRDQALQNYLAAENWFEADKETIKVILAVTAKEINEYHLYKVVHTVNC